MLRAYGEKDLDLQLRLLGDPDTMAHLGGPETPEQIERRHERYLRTSGPDDGRMLVIETAGGVAAGSIGYWPRTWQGEEVWETGWLVLPEFRGQGLAAAAIAAMVEQLHETRRRALHAFPDVGNDASNALCPRGGFTLRGQADFEYPPGHWMRCNDWRRDL